MGEPGEYKAVIGGGVGSEGETVTVSGTWPHAASCPGPSSQASAAPPTTQTHITSSLAVWRADTKGQTALLLETEMTQHALI